MGIFNFVFDHWQKNVEKNLFFKLCKSNNLILDYSENIDSLVILKEVFYERVYSDYFPFYEKANILDIGAHKGYFSIFCSKNIHPESKILSLEPYPDNYSIFIKNLSLNNIANVRVSNVGIFSETSQIDIYPGKPENHSIFNNYHKTLKQPSKGKVSKIDVFSLKDLFEKYEISKIDFLKLDCEGAEYPSIFNADKETLSKINIISMEFHDLKNADYTALKLVKHLEENGFSIKKFIFEPTVIDNNFGKIIAVRL